ncbi:MAG: hypothetical protein WCX31_05810 [Salinivirgaceae bacterium]
MKKCQALNRYGKAKHHAEINSCYTRFTAIKILSAERLTPSTVVFALCWVV